MNMGTSPSEIVVYLNAPTLVSREADGYRNASQPQPSSVGLLLVPDPGLPGSAELPPARRLLVLVPDPTTSIELANRIWSLAAGTQLDVLFVGAAAESQDVYPMRRLLASLAAATRDRQLRVNTQLVPGHNWLRAIRPLWQSGDLIICHQEQTVTAWGFQRLPLAQTLIMALHAPVYVLNGFYPVPPLRAHGFVHRWLPAMLPFLIIVISFGLQVQIEKRFDGGLYYLLMLGSVIIEIGLLAIWH
jgi:hypothetical protein